MNAGPGETGGELSKREAGPVSLPEAAAAHQTSLGSRDPGIQGSRDPPVKLTQDQARLPARHHGGEDAGALLGPRAAGQEPEDGRAGSRSHT